MSVAAPAPADVAAAGARGERLWEVDVLRTVAMVLMVAYHSAYDVDLLGPTVDIDPFGGGWRAVQVACGSSFLTVVGISFWISSRRDRASGLAGADLWRRRARRGAQVLAAALIVSLATLVALGSDEYVRFGILHLIATMVLLVLPLVVRLGVWNAPLGVAAILVGFVVRDSPSDVPGAEVLGFMSDHAGVDWYPLLPWGGCCLIGVAIAAWLYPDGRRGPLLRRLIPSTPRGAVLAGAPGRHALPFYLVHQPVLILITALCLTLAGTTVEWP